MGQRWDIFCRVVDNYGDAGVSWRLARDLARRGETSRLWIDDPTLLTWMAPGGEPGVEVIEWNDPAPDLAPGDVVIETFGCDPPPAFVARMAEASPTPVWINLEYLSAEDHAKRNHRLPSPQQMGPGAGLVKHFFYPGFETGTGGLLREEDLAEKRRRFNADHWLGDRGIRRRDGERLVSLFCYENRAVPAMLEELSRRPTLLLAMQGPASELVGRELGALGRRGKLRAISLPLLTQIDYDHLLWSCDLNFVRGEDSFVRAQWAGRPFVWQAYPQHDDAHIAKLTAFLDLFTAGAAPELAQSVRQLFAAWNFTGTTVPLPSEAGWTVLCTHWRAQLQAMTDLTSRLQGFVAEFR